MPITMEDLCRMQAELSAKHERRRLIDITTIRVDESDDKGTRIVHYLEQVKNPYHFRVGDTVVHVKFSSHGKTLQEAMNDYMASR